MPEHELEFARTPNSENGLPCPSNGCTRPSRSSNHLSGALIFFVDTICTSILQFLPYLEVSAALPPAAERPARGQLALSSCGEHSNLEVLIGSTKDAAQLVLGNPNPFLEFRNLLCGSPTGRRPTIVEPLPSALLPQTAKRGFGRFRPLLSTHKASPKTEEKGSELLIRFALY